MNTFTKEIYELGEEDALRISCSLIQLLNIGFE